MVRSWFVIVALLACVCFTVHTANGAIVSCSGTNTYLGNNSNRLYFPILTDNSGTLGEPCNVDRIVGGTQEVFTAQPGVTLTGNVNFDMNFALTAPIDPADASLILSVYDLNIVPVSQWGVTWSNTLTLTFTRPDESTATLTIDPDTYTTFRQGTGSMRNRTSTWKIDLVNDLGLSIEDIDAINADNSMAMSIEIDQSFTSDVTRDFRTLQHNFQASLDYTPGSGTPEPVSMAMLLAGLPLLLRRRNRN